MIDTVHVTQASDTPRLVIGDGWCESVVLLERKDDSANKEAREYFVAAFKESGLTMGEHNSLGQNLQPGPRRRLLSMRR